MGQQWHEQDYSEQTIVASPLEGGTPVTLATGVTGSGAAKLAASAVAPLVAAARGYRAITPPALREVARDLGFTDMRSAAARQLSDLTGDSDALIMPWHSLLNLRDQQFGNTPSAIQVRPATPRRDPKTGKPRKYEFLSGSDTPLDVHPSTPPAWLSGQGQVVIAEGLLKADAVLTAVLRAAGVCDEDLSWPDGGSTAKAQARLRAMLEGLEPGQQVMVVAIAGVGNWRRNPEWAAADLKGRPVLVALDGDIAASWQVWHQADELAGLLKDSKHAAPVTILDLSGLAGALGEKAGVDDYLAAGATWADVQQLARTQLPPRPQRPAELEAGKWRVNEAAGQVEECVKDQDEHGNATGAHWEGRCRIYGRVSSIETTRPPTDAEAESGILANGEAGGETQAVLELSWREEGAQAPRTAKVTGPAGVLLTDEPRDWPRKGAQIPTGVLRHPDWPMRKTGKDWLTAIKEHRAEETDERIAWSRMGWVPGPAGSGPAFIAGQQVIGPDGLEDLTASGATPGVSDDVLSGASRFGVQLLPPGLGQDERKAQIAADIKAVYEAYISSGAWTQDGVAAAVLAAMLRPCVPLRTTVTLYLMGARASGKSFTASFIMSGWQAEPGTWSEKRLPGSAALDTFSATEHAVARTPIWVADDLAPATDQVQAAQDLQRLGGLIRAIHNGSARRRMTAELTSRHVAEPHALLIVTAENAHPVSSVRDRVIPITMRRGTLGEETAIERLREMRDHDGAPARVTGYVISHIARLARDDGWPAVRERYRLELEQRTEAVKAALLGQGCDQGAASRHSMLIADLGLGLSALGDVAEWAGLPGFKSQATELLYPLAALMITSHADRAENSPGAAVIQAVAKLLASQRAHVSGTDPQSPPIPGQPYAFANTLLGWVSAGDAPMRPCGPRIGVLITESRSGENVVLLDARTAFDEAARAYRELLPHGSTAAAAWTAADDEGLLSESWSRASNGRGRVSTVRVRVGGGQQIRGIPVPLETLLAGGIPETAPPAEPAA